LILVAEAAIDAVRSPGPTRTRKIAGRAKESRSALAVAEVTIAEAAGTVLRTVEVALCPEITCE